MFLNRGRTFSQFAPRLIGAISLHRTQSSIVGFTLIELMMVIVIIGLLAAIALPKFGDALTRAREARNLALLGTLRSAMTLYYADTEGSYPDVISSLFGKYLMYHEQDQIRTTAVRTLPHDWDDWIQFKSNAPLSFWPGGSVDLG